MNFNNKPTAPALQFRRCSTCNGAGVFEPSPSTALACTCGGEMLVATVAAQDLLDQRKHFVSALRALADACADPANQDKQGNVNGKLAAGKMKALADALEAGK